jgi:fused signal recognition particle receptor
VSFLDRITRGLKKSRDALFGAAASVLRPGHALSEEDFEALEAALLRADVGPAATDRLLAGVKQRLSDASHEGTAADALRSGIEELLRRGDSAGPSPGTSRPHVTLVVGVNGTGKTTTIAKLASRMKGEGKSVLLVACDTFRAAAAGVEIVKHQAGSDPAAVAYDGMARATSRGVDRVLVDTAGRLHVKANLMAELTKIRRVIGRGVPGAPHETLLVLDATVGQNGLAQAREFTRAVPLTGIALTKLDGTAKGGIALAIVEELGVPIRWVGVGEGMEDLIPFDPAEFAAALVGV